MVLAGSKPAFALALLMNIGLAWAAEQAPASSAIPVADAQIPAGAAPGGVPPMQAWPQMMPFPGMPTYYWTPPPGMMWPMQQAYPAQMVMPPMPPVTWIPFVWVMVPQTPAGGVNGVAYGPVAETPVVQLPAPAQPAPQVQTPLAQGNSEKSATVAPVIPEPAPLPVTPPDQSRFVDYGPVLPAPVVALPVPAVAPVTPQAPVPKADTARSDQGAAPKPVAAETEVILASPPAGQQALAETTTVEPEIDATSVDYGPVAATPVVDLLALIAPNPAKIKAPTISNKVKTRRAPRKSKSRAAVTSKPAKQRMCWTQGVVAPCK